VVLIDQAVEPEVEVEPVDLAGRDRA